MANVKISALTDGVTAELTDAIPVARAGVNKQITPAYIKTLFALSGTNTGDNAGVTSVTGTAPIVSSGGNTPAISIPAATNAVAGHATAAHIAAIEANTAKVTNATHTGDATGATALVVVKINGTSLAALATGILKNTTTTGVPSIALNSDLPAMSATAGGAVPTPPNNTTTFLRGDGTFAAPGGSGDMVLASAQTNAGVKTFLDTTLALRNVANTFSGVFVNTITAARAWTLKDAAGTIAFTSDITGTNSGTNTGDQTSIVGITGTTAQFNTALSDNDFATLAGVETLTNKSISGGQITSAVANATLAANVTTNANLTGDVTSVGNATTLTNAPVIAKVLTGYVSGAGTVAATDSILAAIQKLNGNDATNANLTGGVTSVGNAATVVTNANLTGHITSVGNAAVLGAFTSAQLATALTDETGSGAAVFGTAPAIAGGTHTAITGLGVRSTGTGAFDLKLANAENLTVSDKTLTVTLNNANRNLTVSGDATVTGSNTGDQTITLTGDVTGSGIGSFAATIAADSVTYAKIQNVSATDKLLGRSTAGAGDVEEIACTAAARTVLDDATVAAMVDTLGGAASTGTGGIARATSPVFVTPALGTPSAVVLTSATGLPLTTGVTGTLPVANGGTGVTTSTGSGANVLGTKPAINGTDPTGATYAPATGAQTVALDCAANNIHVVSGHASGTAITFTVANVTNSQPFIVSVLQGATTVSTIAAWFATVRWAGGVAPTLTATLNKRDTFGFIRTGVDTYDGFIVGQNC